MICPGQEELEINLETINTYYGLNFITWKLDSLSVKL